MTDEAQTMARTLRYIAVREYHDAGMLTRENALEILRGCLSPGDESTRCDDSVLLDASPAAIAEFLSDIEGQP